MIKDTILDPACKLEIQTKELEIFQSPIHLIGELLCGVNNKAARRIKEYHDPSSIYNHFDFLPLSDSLRLLVRSAIFTYMEYSQDYADAVADMEIEGVLENHPIAIAYLQELVSVQHTIRSQLRGQEQLSSRQYSSR